jgi:peptidoglycan hydrolase-like protein with peptidoglycan-binding domain
MSQAIATPVFNINSSIFHDTVQNRPAFLTGLTVRPAPLFQKPAPTGLIEPADLFSATAAKSGAHHNVNFVDETPEAPSIEAVRQGAVIEFGHSGAGVADLQKLLTRAGFEVPTTAKFAEITESQLKAFQRSRQIEANGKLGKTTLKALESTPPAGASTPFSRQIAATARAIASARGTFGSCYNAVADAIEKHTGTFLYGGHAYMSAEQFAAHPRFKEIAVPNNMNELPVGAVVVWDRAANPANRHRGGGWTSGHIAVYLGNGQEASDHIAPQMQTHYGGGKPRIFLPV